MSDTVKLTFAEARRRLKANPVARWSSVADQFDGDVWPEVQPGFRLRPGQTVFTIGSCFARNIEQHLAGLGLRVPMLDLRIPPDEWGGAPNGAMNRFHPPSFRQCLEWTAAVWDRDRVVGWSDCEPFVLACGEGMAFDLDVGCTGPVSRDRFLERRQHIFDVFSSVFTSDCLVMTPGLIEAWRDSRTGLYLHSGPDHRGALADRDRWTFEILGYERCLADMLAAIDLVRARNPGVLILLTTSPVPMSVTCSGQDVRTANAYSKSVLRAVCGAVVHQRERVDYFPSYESVLLSAPEGVWSDDRIHVSSAFVGRIVARLLDRYLDDVAVEDRSYQRAETLMQEGDFAAAEASARATLEASPDHFEARVLLADALVRQEKWDDAEVGLRALIDRHPERAGLWTLLARALARHGRGDLEASIACVERAVSLPSRSLSDFRTNAELIRRHASPEVAERIQRQGVSLYPNHALAYPPLVDLFLAQGRKAEAMQALESAVGLRHCPTALRLLQAELLAEAGRTNEAMAAVSAILSREPRQADALRLAGRVTAGAVNPSVRS